MYVPEWLFTLLCGFIVGIAIGYAIKVAFKLLLLIFGFYSCVTGFLWYIGVVKFDFSAGAEFISNLWDKLLALTPNKAVAIGLAVFPPLFGFLVGLGVGLKL